MGKKGRNREKKTPELKSKEDRFAEVLDIFGNFKEIGLDKRVDGVVEFFSICKEYVNDGVGRHGKIKLIGNKRIIEYTLPTKKQIVASVNLKYDKNV
jgi:hypothetical protein